MSAARPAPPCRRRIIVRRSETPLSDMLYAQLGGVTLQTWNAKRGNGGEWDFLAALPLRQRRRLTGAGYMGRHGEAPDVFADLVRSSVTGAGSWSDSECIRWYCTTALRAIAERRTAHHYDRHLAVALAAGAPSYYALRDAQAWLEGYESLWCKRKAKGWV